MKEKKSIIFFYIKKGKKIMFAISIIKNIKIIILFFFPPKYFYKFQHNPSVFLVYNKNEIKLFKKKSKCEKITTTEFSSFLIFYKKKRKQQQR